MVLQHPDYRIDLDDGAGWPRGLANECDFRIDEERIVRGLCVSLPPLERDLVHVAMAVYAADRLARRRHGTHEGARNVRLRIQVNSPSLWTGLRDVIEETLFSLSHDRWELQFEFGQLKPIPGALFSLRDEPAVCLYSGGLDSAAGLAGRLGHLDRQIVCGTACHQPGQRQRVQSQLERMKAVHSHDVFSLAVRAALVRPPLLKEQELSQRCRSFLFCSLGAVVASISGSHAVEVYESGVGALNLPPMAGMAVGARSTKGCHPNFLRLMSEVASSIAQRSITFELPFADSTKAEAEQLEPLRAILLQVSALRRCHGNGGTAALRRYANGTGVVQAGEPMAAWTTVLNRYCDEWLQLIPHMRQRGIRWANLIAPIQRAS